MKHLGRAGFVTMFTIITSTICERERGLDNCARRHICRPIFCWYSITYMESQDRTTCCQKSLTTYQVHCTMTLRVLSGNVKLF